MSKTYDIHGMLKDKPVIIAGYPVSLSELQGDVDASIRRGYHPTLDFSFTSATVQGLIDYIKENCK